MFANFFDRFPSLAVLCGSLSGRSTEMKWNHINLKSVIYKRVTSVGLRLNVYDFSFLTFTLHRE